VKGLIFTYALTYGGVVVSLFNPFVGLLIYVCFSVLKPEMIWHYSVPPGNYSRIIAIGLLIGWAANGFGNWNFGRGKLSVFLLLGFYGWFVLSSFGAEYPAYAWWQTEALGKIVLPCLVGATLIDSRERLRQLAWVITLSTGYWAYREQERYFAMAIESFDNQIAHTFAVGAGVALMLAFIETKTWLRLIALACSGLMVHGVMFHMSRGAMLGVGVVGIVAFALVPKSREIVRWLVVICVAGAIMAGPSVRREFQSIFASEEERDSSAQSRTLLWSAMWDVAVRNPIVGVGPQGWPRIADQYGFARGKQGHGLWVQALAETGFPGGLLYLGFFVCSICTLGLYVRRPAEEIDPNLQLYSIMIIASLCGWIVEAQFGSFYGIELPYYLVMLGIGVLRLTTSPQPQWIPIETFGRLSSPALTS
jgi:O-antigen ligase